MASDCDVFRKRHIVAFIYWHGSNYWGGVLVLIKKSYLVICLFLSATLTSNSNTALASASMTEGNAISAPWGFIDFCKRSPKECPSSQQKVQKVPLTPKRAAELAIVQLHVNRKIIYATDGDHYGRKEYWNYPRVRGDCEDYALEKRRRLIAAGWPRSALLLTAARMQNGQKHLVLVAVTEMGDFVLDNLSQNVRHWKSMDYRWLGRQSRFKESDWVSLNTDGTE